MYVDFYRTIFPCFSNWSSIGGKKMSIFDTTGFVIISVFFLGILIGIIALFSILKGKLRRGYLLKIKILATYIGGILFISFIYIFFIFATVVAIAIGTLRVCDIYV